MSTAPRTRTHEVRHHTGVRDWTACGFCGEPLEYFTRPLEERRGRTPDYCGGACRQAAHRLRQRKRRTLDALAPEPEEVAP
jgi:hypothetical protein